MRTLFLGALPCLLALPAAAQSPLTLQDLQAKARPAPEQWRAEVLLAERALQVREARGFLREGPTVALFAGPRRNPDSGTRTDRGVELDLPLFLSPGLQAALAASLGKAHPLLEEAARRESRFRLHAAYLDAWLSAREVGLREADLQTVDQWLRTARLRLEAGADPAFQVALVEGERLKVQQDLDEARLQAARCWGALVTLADLPMAPAPLAEPGALPTLDPADLGPKLQASPLRQALLAQADLETRSLQLKEAVSLSRLSLRGSFTAEGDDKVARMGLALRLPRPGETAAARRSTEVQLRALQGETRQALAELEARSAALLQRLTPSAGAAPPDFSAALQAVGLRLSEGRERPSEALPIRRQLLEAQLASLRRTHARHLLNAELQSLLPEVNP